MNSKDFPVSNELINRAVDALRVLSYANRLEEFPHALHQLIHDHNAQLAKMGFGKIPPPKSPIEAGDFQNMVTNLNELQADSVEAVLHTATTPRMKDTVAYVLTTITASMCYNKLDKIARAREDNQALSDAIDELANKVVKALDEFQRPFNASEDDGNIGL